MGSTKERQPYIVTSSGRKLNLPAVWISLIAVVLFFHNIPSSFLILIPWNFGLTVLVTTIVNVGHTGVPQIHDVLNRYYSETYIKQPLDFVFSQDKWSFTTGRINMIL